MRNYIKRTMFSSIEFKFISVSKTNTNLVCFYHDKVNILKSELLNVFNVSSDSFKKVSYISLSYYYSIISFKFSCISVYFIPCLYVPPACIIYASIHITHENHKLTNMDNKNTFVNLLAVHVDIYHFFGDK